MERYNNEYNRWKKHYKKEIIPNEVLSLDVCLKGWKQELKSIKKDWDEQLNYHREKISSREFTTKKSVQAVVRRMKDDQDYYGHKFEKLIERIDSEATTLIEQNKEIDIKKIPCNWSNMKW